jgi:hypothetical protein
MTPASESELVEMFAQQLRFNAIGEDGPPWHDLPERCREDWRGEARPLIRLVTAHNAARLREWADELAECRTEYERGLRAPFVVQLRTAADKLEKGAPDGTDPR